MSLHQLVSLVLPSKSTSHLVVSVCVGIEMHENKSTAMMLLKTSKKKMWVIDFECEVM